MKPSVSYEKKRDRYRIEFRVPTGDPKHPYKRIRKFRRSKQAANTVADEFRIRFKTYGATGFNFDPALWDYFCYNEDRLGDNGTIEAAVDFFLKHHKPALDDCSLEDALERFHEAKVKAGISDRWADTLRYFWRKLSAAFPDALLRELTAENLSNYIYSLEVGPEARSNTYSQLRNFLNFCVRQEWIEKNPADKFDRPRFERGGRTVANVSKKYWSWSDTYGIDIVEGEDVVSILATCVVIDLVLHDDKN